MKKTTFESKFTVGDDVWFRGVNNTPTHSIITQVTATLRRASQSISYFVGGRMRSESEIFEREEDVI